MRPQQADNWNRRDFLTASLAAGAGGYLGFIISPRMAAAEPPPETTTLRLRVWKPACWAPFHVSETLLRAEGFTDIQYVWAAGGQRETLQILKDGGVDLSPSFSALDMFNMERQGLPLKFLAGLHVGCYGLIGSERVNSVRDLKGKTVWTGAVSFQVLSGVNSRAVDLTKLHSKTAAFRRLQHDTTAQLYSAASGPEALNILESEEPDLILLDVLMPNMNGYQVCRRIRENPAMQTVPVIMMTGLDPSEEKAKGRDVGATDIIVKPIHLADLLERLHFLGIRGDDERSNGA